MNEYQLRQTGILIPDKVKDITVVGAGGIGSWTTLVLTKMGFQNIKVIDFDGVEEHNIGSQFYEIEDLGQSKLESLKKNISSFSDVQIETHEERIDRTDTEVLILAVDNMDARKEIIENSKFEFCIDGRMGGETFTIYSFYREELDRYKQTLFPQSESTQEPCTARAICYNTFGIASLIGMLMKRYNNNETIPFEMNFCYKNLFFDNET